jgi:predicted site-specific integrase-resolvase
MTPEDVAHEFSVDRRTVLKWAREGKLHSVRRSRKIIRFSREYIISLGRTCTEAVESPTSRKTEVPARNLSTLNKKGGRKASRKSWRSLREEVTKCR